MCTLNSFGASDLVESAQLVISQLQNLLQTSGFQLRKCASHEPLAIERLQGYLKTSSLTHAFCSCLHLIPFHLSELLG